MKADKVRETFLQFFAAENHERLHSSSLVPSDDPTLLFTNAGMVQFKDLFTGREKRAYKKATTSQKCVRAGGKHNDLDEVGKTARHHTFFEMLGNFSFGDYFKEDAITWAWKLLTNEYGIDPDKLVVSYFGGDKDLGVGADTEAKEIWKSVSGLPDNRIIGLGASENFWMMGETGPMGPCSEIHFCTNNDHKKPPTTAPESWEGWLEIWNLVFMQYERKVAGGKLDNLPAPSIDTGAGLERVTAVMQGKSSNYDTDLFLPLLKVAAKLAKKKYGDNESMDTSMRVLADHARASTFLIADGVFPDKTGREYVLRRIFRRAVRHGKLLGIEEPFMHRLCECVVAEMSGAFPELQERKAIIHEIALEEEKRFRSTLDRGLSLLDEEFVTLKKNKSTTVTGQKVFQLYDTFGFPADLTEIIAEENGFSLDHDGFKKELEKARERSKFAGADSAVVADLYKDLANEFEPTTFTGYQSYTGKGKVLAVLVEGKRQPSAKAGQTVAIVCDQTPFYGESGGQVGDSGEMIGQQSKLKITDTQKPAGGVFVHLGTVLEGTLKENEAVELRVEESKRRLTKSNHSATHLLHLGLKKVLGDHVAQKGSLVTPEKLRFDFAHFNPMSYDEKNAVEDWVNSQIRDNTSTTTEVLPVEEAKKKGATAMFGEKYGATVRVVQIGGESLEFCGGTHVERSGDIGIMKILSETGIAQGVRRIEAVTGPSAIAHFRSVENELNTVGKHLKVAPLGAADRVQRMQSDMKGLEKQVGKLKTKLASGGSKDLLSNVKEIAGVKVLAISTEVDDVKALRETGDNLRDRLGSGVIVLAGVGADRVSLLAMVTKDLTKTFHAGKILQKVAQVLDGKGGGRPDMAQGGGKDVTKVDEALETALEAVRASC